MTEEIYEGLLRPQLFDTKHTISYPNIRNSGFLMSLSEIRLARRTEHDNSAEIM